MGFALPARYPSNSATRQAINQLIRQSRSKTGNGCPGDEVADLTHRHASIATGVDPAKRLHVHGHVQGQAVERTSSPYTQPQRRNLRLFHIDTRRIRTRRCRHTHPRKGPDNGLLNDINQGANSQAVASQVYHQVNHKLARAVIRYLATAIHQYHRDITGGQYVLGFAGLEASREAVNDFIASQVSR